MSNQKQTAGESLGKKRKSAEEVFFPFFNDFLLEDRPTKTLLDNRIWIETTLIPGMKIERTEFRVTPPGEIKERREPQRERFQSPHISLSSNLWLIPEICMFGTDYKHSKLL